MKIRPVGAELFHATDGQTDINVDDNNRYSKFCQRAYNTTLKYKFVTVIKGNL